MAKRRSRNDQNGRRLRVIDITDRELLFNIHDALEHDGWATTTGVALECGFPPADPNRKHETPARKVASRLAYMRDGGLLESAPPDRTKPYENPGDRDLRWRLTPIGEAIRQGKLTPAVERALGSLDAGGLVMLQSAVTKQAYLDGDQAVAFTFRREMQHNFAKRKLVIRGR